MTEGTADVLEVLESQGQQAIRSGFSAWELHSIEDSLRGLRRDYSKSISGSL